MYLCETKNFKTCLRKEDMKKLKIKKGGEI